MKCTQKMDNLKRALQRKQAWPRQHPHQPTMRSQKDCKPPQRMLGMDQRQRQKGMQSGDQMAACM